jgi:hypothetical protein
MSKVRVMLLNAQSDGFIQHRTMSSRSARQAHSRAKWHAMTEGDGAALPKGPFRPHSARICVVHREYISTAVATLVPAQSVSSLPVG